MRLVLRLGLRLTLLCELAACSEIVTLGSECPTQSGPCPQLALDAAPDRGTMTPLALDASRPAPVDATRSSPVDAAPPVTDSAPPVGKPGPEPALMPALQNPSFELAEGSDQGAVAAISFIPGRASILPWYTCQAFASEGLIAMQARTQADLPLSDGGVTEQVLPQDGAAFVIAQPPANIGVLVLPLIQQLEQPLQPGKRYAFTLDVRTSGTNALMPVSLRVGGATESSCTQFELLDQSELLTNHEWKSICFSFVPDVAYSHILLQANFETISTASLYLDNLQPTAGCSGS